MPSTMRRSPRATSVAVDEDTSVTVNVLGNDGDVDGDTLAVTGASAGHGTVTVNGDGSLTYKGDANFNGTDTITYSISDGKGGTASCHRGGDGQCRQ